MTEPPDYTSASDTVTGYVGSPPTWTADDLWPPARRRPEFAVLVAAVGGFLLLIGLVGLFDEFGDGDGAAWAAALFSAAVVVAALAGLSVYSADPPASTLVVVVLLGVLATLGFIVETTEPDGLRGPASFVLGLATLTWALLFLLGPTRGRPAFLAAGLVGLWLLVTVQMLDYGGRGNAFGDGDNGPFGGLFDPFGIGSGGSDAAGISLLFGIAYLVAAGMLDARGRHGGATPFVAVADAALLLGVVWLVFESTPGGAVLGIVVGVALCLYGALTDRRFTAWFGAAGLALATLGLVGDSVDNSKAESLLILAAGLVFAVGAWWLRQTGIVLRIPGADDAPADTSTSSYQSPWT